MYLWLICILFISKDRCINSSDRHNQIANGSTTTTKNFNMLCLLQIVYIWFVRLNAIGSSKIRMQKSEQNGMLMAYIDRIIKNLSISLLNIDFACKIIANERIFTVCEEGSTFQFTSKTIRTTQHT